jgi:cytochrome b561
MFIVVLSTQFQVIEAIESTRSPKTDEWIKKMWHMYIYVCLCICVYSGVIFYSTIKMKETRWFEGKWMQLVDIMLSELSQDQKDKSHMFSLIYGR